MKLTDNVKIRVCDSSMLPKQILNELKCFLVIKGSMEINFNDMVFNLKSDDILVVNHKEVFTIRENSPNVVLMISISEEYLKDECGNTAHEYFECNSTCASLDLEKNYFEIKRILIRLFLILCKKDNGYELEVRALFFQFLHYLTIHFKKDSPDEIPIREENETISNILIYINRNYYKNLSLEKITKLFSFSKQYFSKFFKQKTGIGFFEYLTSMRLEHAVEELEHTDDSVLKIAMNNGFANSKSFTRAFQRKYNQTPSDYRKINKINQAHPQMVNGHFFDSEMEEENLMALLKYMNQYGDEVERGEGKTEKVQFSLKNIKPKPYNKLEKIIILGTLEGPMKMQTIEQLQEVQKELHFQYVYFEMFSKKEYLLDKLNKHYDLEFYIHYEDIRCFEKVGLYPFIEIDFSKIRHSKEFKQEISIFMEYFGRWLRFLINNFSDEYMKQWRIVFSYSKKEHVEEFLNFFILLYPSKENLSFGIRLLPEDCLSDSQYPWILHYLKRKSCIPDFLTFQAVPQKEMILKAETVYYQRMATERIYEAFRQTGCHIDNIYLTHWNTLVGETEAERGEFYRAALIVDAIESLRGMVKGVGFYLNTFHMSTEGQEIDTSKLALYLYFQVKRPVYFIVKAFNRMGGNLLFQKNSITVASTRKNEYVTMVSNPYYVEPITSLDSAYMQKQKKSVEIVFEDLEQGDYQLKTFVIDKGKGGMFNRWAEAGYPGIMDRDLISYLENAIVPELSISVIRIDKQYVLHSEITFNGVILYILTKM